MTETKKKLAEVFHVDDVEIRPRFAPTKEDNAKPSWPEYEADCKKHNVLAKYEDWYNMYFGPPGGAA